VASDSPLSVRFTLRLPIELRDWVSQQGGGSFVRQVLSQHRAAQAKEQDYRPHQARRDLYQQWEQLADERGSLRDERALLDDHERLLERRESHLERRALLLDDRREQLEDEWDELEQRRLELENREHLFAGLFRPAVGLLDLLSLAGGHRV